jgi:hypothetical protein
MNFSDELDFQLRELAQLATMAAELSQRILDAPNDQTLVLAMATIVHGFYSGVERIFRDVARWMGDSPVGGEGWHKALLASVAQAASNRPAVISDALHGKLLRYLAFRHRFLNIFPQRLEWEPLKPLADELPATAERTIVEFHAFVETVADEVA